VIHVLQLSLEALFRRCLTFVLEETISSCGFVVDTLSEIRLDGLFSETFGLQEVQDLDLIISTRKRPTGLETLSETVGGCRSCGIGCRALRCV